jgi:XapX domain-containing protein
MRSFAISFAVGLAVGVLYALLRVRSPAPPLIALVGLLGMVLGEQFLPVLKTLVNQLAVVWKS